MLIPKVIFNRQKPLKLDNATVCICSTVFFPFTAEYTRYSCPLLLSDQIDNTNYFFSKKKVDSDCPKVRRLDSEKKWFVLNYLFLTLFRRLNWPQKKNGLFIGRWTTQKSAYLNWPEVHRKLSIFVLHLSNSESKNDLKILFWHEAWLNKEFSDSQKSVLKLHLCGVEIELYRLNQHWLDHKTAFSNCNLVTLIKVQFKLNQGKNVWTDLDWYYGLIGCEFRR